MGDDELKLMKNDEEWELPEDEDYGEMRLLYKVVCCPAPDCSHSSWNNGKCWSWISEYQCRCYLARHLKVSALHNADVADAMILAGTAEMEITEQTAVDRQAERQENAEHIAKMNAKAKEKRPAASGKGGGKGGGNSGGGGGGGSGGGSSWRQRLPHSPSRSPPRRSPRRSRSPPRHHAIGAIPPKTPELGMAKTFASSIDQLNTTMKNLGSVFASGAVPAGSPTARVPAQAALLNQGGGASSSSSGGGVSILGQEMTAVPTTHLRLLVQSIRQVRNSVEQLAVQIPVLNAAETAINQHICN